MLALVIAASINAIAGDLSAAMGYVHGDTETDRIRGHLMFAHDVLAAADVSLLPPELRAARAKNLERLLVYARAGQFPRNDGHPDARRPTFVDDDGEICAVGALYASDRGYPAAVRIASKFKYAYIPTIDDADLAAWQKTSGLAPEELALIQPAYGWDEERYSPPPYKLWDAWGLTDRSLFGPSRMSITQEVSSVNAYDTTTTTLYGHTTLPGAKRTSMYLTLPIGFTVEKQDDAIAAAGGTVTSEAPAYWFGNADVGLYWGKDDHDEGSASNVRLGALLPTGKRFGQPAGMRAGDFVMELPRSYGLRLATSRMIGWRSGYGDRGGYAVRFDAGFDIARGTEAEHAQYYVPRAAIGLMKLQRFYTASLDASAAHVFDEHADGSLRLSVGTTFRFGLRDGRPMCIGAFQPALTFAAVRTTEGWGGVFALELAMAMKQSRPSEY